MIYILDKLGSSSKICNVIKSMYKKTKPKYIFGEFKRDWVTLERGISQGCVLPPLLFSLYTEELAARVRESGLGVNINAKKIIILLYVDYIALIVENKNIIQEMLNIVSDYDNEFCMSFKKNKCAVMEINKPEGGKKDFKLGNKKIETI